MSLTEVDKCVLLTYDRYRDLLECYNNVHSANNTNNNNNISHPSQPPPPILGAGGGGPRVGEQVHRPDLHWVSSPLRMIQESLVTLDLKDTALVRRRRGRLQEYPDLT